MGLACCPPWLQRLLHRPYCLLASLPCGTAATAEHPNPTSYLSLFLRAPGYKAEPQLQARDQWKRPSPVANQSSRSAGPLLGTLGKRRAGPPPPAPCVQSPAWGQHMHCARGAQGPGELHGEGVGKAVRAGPHCVFPTTAVCHGAGPQFRDTASELPPGPGREAGSEGKGRGIGLLLLG